MLVRYNLQKWFLTQNKPVSQHDSDTFPVTKDDGLLGWIGQAGADFTHNTQTFLCSCFIVQNRHFEPYLCQNNRKASLLTGWLEIS